MPRVACYVDGFNMYHALAALGRPKFKWLNLWALSETFLHSDDELVAVYYFTAIHNHEQQKAQRHRRYIDALKACGVKVVISRFQTSDKFCRQNQRSCPFLEEKQTDVALATTLLADAMDGFMDRAVLITADSDHVPLVTMVQEKRPMLGITLAPPPGRMHQARDLGKLIPDRKEISEGRLTRCLLPRDVYKANGKIAATCPTAYLEISN